MSKYNEGKVLFHDIKTRGILKLADFFQINGEKKVSKKHSEGSSTLERSPYKISKSVTLLLLCLLGLPTHDYSQNYPQVLCVLACSLHRTNSLFSSLRWSSEAPS